MEIPEVKIDESGKFEEETKTIPIKINGEMKEVVLKKLTAGARGKIRSACSKTKYIGTQPQIEVNDAELEAQLMKEAILKAPFPHELNDIKELPSEVFDYLMNAFQDFSGVSDKKKDE